MIYDFSALSQRQRDRVLRYVDSLTESQADRLAAMTPEQAAAAITPGEAGGLGFFWWIIEAAYAVYTIKQAKDKKAKAKKKADEMKKKAAADIKKEKDKLTKIEKELNELDKLKAEQAILPPAVSSALPVLIGLVALGGGLLYLIKRRKKT